MTIPYVWWYSAEDKQVHAFRSVPPAIRAFTAVCKHEAPAEQWEADDQGHKCEWCIYIVGTELAEQHGDKGYAG